MGGGLMSLCLKKDWWPARAIAIGAFLLAIRSYSSVSLADQHSAQVLDPETKALLQDLDRQGDSVRDLSARYEERKLTAILKAPMVTTGRVRIVGARARWDADAPHSTVTLVDPNEVRIYYPERSTVEVYPISAQLQFPTVSPLPRWKELSRHFRMESRSATKEESELDASSHLFLSLIPLQSPLRDHVATINVAIERSTGLLHRAEITDPDGDRTVMRFSNVQTNTGTKLTDLDLALPDGTVVTWPLSPKKSNEPKAAGD